VEHRIQKECAPVVFTQQIQRRRHSAIPGQHKLQKQTKFDSGGRCAQVHLQGSIGTRVHAHEVEWRLIESVQPCEPDPAQQTAIQSSPAG